MGSRKPSILYLTYDGLTDPLGQSQILPYITKLASLGWKYTIISSEKRDKFVSSKTSIEEICKTYGIGWHPLKYHKRPPILSTLYDLWKLRQAAFQHTKKNGPCIVHCRSYLTSIIGLELKNKFNCKFIFDMRGFWADERVEGGLWNLKNPIYRFIYYYFKRKEKSMLANADHVITLTLNARLEIQSWKIKPAPITIIPTCVDLALFNPDKISNLEQQILRRQLGITEDEFVLLYLGSWGTWYMTEEMLDFFSTVKSKYPKAKFLIVSNDAIDLRNYRHATDVIVTRSSRNLVPLHISLASLAVCFIKPSFSKKASSATKLGEILAMGKQVISNPGWGDIDQLTYSNWVSLVNPKKRFDFEMLTHNLDKPSLTELSLQSGVTKYSKVFEDVS